MARAFAGFVWPSQHQIRYTHGSCWDDVWLARILVPRVRCVCVCECFLLNLSTLFTLVQWPTRRITSIGGSPISAHTHVNVGAVVLLLVLQMKDLFFCDSSLVDSVLAMRMLRMPGQSYFGYTLLGAFDSRVLGSRWMP